MKSVLSPCIADFSEFNWWFRRILKELKGE
jgi:hypothetical protein